jgi:hypothetical protein
MSARQVRQNMRNEPASKTESYRAGIQATGFHVPLRDEFSRVLVHSFVVEHRPEACRQY